MVPACNDTRRNIKFLPPSGGVAKVIECSPAISRGDWLRKVGRHSFERLLFRMGRSEEVSCDHPLQLDRLHAA